MKKPLTGSALKWIAILTMLIDHVGACLIEVFVMNAYGTSPLAGRLNGSEESRVGKECRSRWST